VLANSASRKVGVDINSALCLIRQLVPAVAILHQHARDTAHGCIAPERIVIGPNARLVVSEHVFGSALEQLRFSPERYWKELRVAVPFSPGQPRFDHRGDVMHIGLVALALILGRLLKDEEYPREIADLVASTWAISARGGFEPLPPGLRGWLGRTLQLDPATGFVSVTEVRTELDRVLGDANRIASRESLEAFLARYNASMPAKQPVSRVAAEQKTLGARPASPVQPPAKDASASRPAAVANTSAIPEPRKVVQAPAQTAPLQKPSAAEREPFSTGRYEPGPGHSLFGEKSERPGPPTWLRVAGGLVLLGLLAVAGIFAGRSYFLASPAAGATGTLEVTTNPNGADVFIDGRGRGVTPLTVTLPFGEHVVQVRGPTGVARSVPVTIEVGNLTSQFIDLPSEVVATGQLQIRTDPPGATISVDGVSRGTSPATLTGLSPGEHQVVLDSDSGSVTEMVTISAGLMASLVVPLGGVPDPTPVSGWVSVASTVELQLYEGGSLLGVSATDRIMLESGRHEIELVNKALGYRSSHVVQVMPGQVASIAVEMPEGVIALNAVPWAEVWIDGVRIGETPIGNHGLPIGQHSVLFRHPELGEQHHTATVTLNGVTRLSVDMKVPVSTEGSTEP
jgi:hypothetical protein